MKICYCGNKLYDEDAIGIKSTASTSETVLLVILFDEPSMPQNRAFCFLNCCSNSCSWEIVCDLCS